MVQIKARIRALVPQALLRATTPFRTSVGLRLRRMRTALFALVPPRTLNQKIRYRMLYDRNPLLTTFCDKWAVREYVAERVGEQVLTKVYALVSDPGELDIDALPDRCVIKPTHGSGAVIIVDDRADAARKIPFPNPDVEWTTAKVRVRKEQLRSEAFLALTRSWLGTIYAKDHEPAYRDVPPRLVVEELLGNLADEGPPPDLRFFCVDGEVKFITLDSGWSPDIRRAVLSPDWQRLDATIAYPAPDEPPARPEGLPTATETAIRLASGVDFIRVDLYALQDRVVFGELTNYHAGGGQKMTPDRVFIRLMADWRPHLDYGPYLLRHLRRRP